MHSSLKTAIFSNPGPLLAVFSTLESRLFFVFELKRFGLESNVLNFGTAHLFMIMMMISQHCLNGKPSKGCNMICRRASVLNRQHEVRGPLI